MCYNNSMMFIYYIRVPEISELLHDMINNPEKFSSNFAGNYNYE